MTNEFVLIGEGIDIGPWLKFNTESKSMPSVTNRCLDGLQMLIYVNVNCHYNHCVNCDNRIQSLTHGDMAPNIDTSAWAITDIRKTSVETFWLHGGVDVFSQIKNQTNKDDNTRNQSQCLQLPTGIWMSSICWFVSTLSARRRLW